MRRLLQDLTIMLRANLWLLPVLAGLVGAVFLLVAPPPPMHATMATGFAGGGYAAFGEKLQRELAKQGFDLQLVTSDGSFDNLNRLLDDTSGVNLALVQSGTEQSLPAEQQARLHSLGAVYQEPLWLFHRREVKLERMADLQTLRLALGADGSATQALTRAILQANQIEPDDYPSQWQAVGGTPAVEALFKDELDAAFFIGPAENVLIQRLAAAEDISLVHFGRAAAYQARLPYLRQVEVGEGLLNLATDSPARDLTLLAPSATLLVNDDFHPALSALILDAARQVMAQGTLLDKPGQFPSAKPVTLPLLGEAHYYHDKGLPLLQRYLPFRIASLADRYIILLIPLLVLLIPLFKAVGPLYRWRIRARIYRWYKYLREVEHKLDSGTPPSALHAELAQLEQLEDQLAKVEVPLSYSSELYDLHLHLDYLIRRLRSLQQRQQAASASDHPND